jgi:hypothetical protein
LFFVKVIIFRVDEKKEKKKTIKIMLRIYSEKEINCGYTMTRLKRSVLVKKVRFRDTQEKLTILVKKDITELIC